VVKLYPHDGRVLNASLLQWGLAGNMTLYKLNTDAIGAMLEGQLLPHPAMNLVSVLAITFIGLKKLPTNWLKSTFHIHRRVVYKVLVWLKTNNRLYKDIIISADQVAHLPEDDIPMALLAAM